MPSESKYSDYATKAAKVLTDQFYPARKPYPRDEPGKWWTENSGFWHSANALECLIDTGDAARSVIGPAYDAYYEKREGWSYYDDLGWWGVAIQKASVFEKSDVYYHEAVYIFNELCGGWDDKNKGGLWWKRSPKTLSDRSTGNFKCSISTELFMVLCGRLFNQNQAPSQGERQVFLDWAIKAWLWIKNSGLVDEHGLFWGRLSIDGSVYRDNVPWTYTQGVILGGLCEIYTATGDLSYIDAALPFADVTLQKMCWPDGVLREHCEGDEANPCDNDQKQFKGVFMRYLGQLYGTLLKTPDTRLQAYREAIERYKKFIQFNADSLGKAYPGGTFGLDWHRDPGQYEPEKCDWIAGILQTSALDCFNSAVVTVSPRSR